MNRIRIRIRIVGRLACLLVTMAGAVLASTASVPAAFALPAPPAGGGPDTTVSPPPPVHTVVIGGMPGWQIALIAAGAAVLAATLAVILDRAQVTRRHLAAPST
jgi:hypothetical protein